MARIETYQRDNFISDSDIVIGSDGDNLNITKNYTIGQLKTYFTEGFVNIGGSGGAGVDTNFYLNGISTDENYLVTFSVVGATDQTLQLGSAAFSETTDFVSTAHTHVVADITDAGALASVNIINNTYIDKSNAGTSGQVLSLGTGAQFTWVDAVGSDTVGADELNISGTPSDGDVITYNSGNLLWATRNFLALSDTPAAFGATGALLKVNATADGLEFFTPSFAATSHTHTLSEITDSGDLAALDLITTSELDTVNTGSNTQVLALNNNLDLQWVTLTAASGIALTDLSVTQNSSGTAALSYNNSTGVFSYTPPDLSGYALTSHTHLLSDITDSGALAALDTITPSEITVTGTPTTAKVLGWSDANSFAWVDQTGGSGGTTYTQGDGIVITAANVIQLADDITVDNITVNENVTVTGDTTIGGDTIIGGDLTVNGITTTVNVNDLVINDRFIEINSGQTTTNVNDSGIIIERGSLTNAVLLWDESLDRFIVGTGNITAATTDANVSYSYSDMQASTFHGALAGNAATSSKWATARTLSFTGDVTASLPVQGHANASATATIGNDKVTKSKLKGLSNEAAESGKVVVSDGNDGFNLVAQSTITSADKAFTDLTDTPTSLTANNFVKVNPQGDALEYLPKVAESHLDIVNDPENGYVLEWDDTNNKMQWVPQAGGGVSNFTALTDTPNDYTNNHGKVPFVAEFDDEGNALDPPRLVFKHITFGDIYNSSGSPIGNPPEDGNTYVLVFNDGTYSWVLESTIVESGGGTVVITDPTAAYNETGCSNRNQYLARNPLQTNDYNANNFRSIVYYNGYLYAIDRKANRYKSTTQITAENNFNIGDLSQSASWTRINNTSAVQEAYINNLTVLPDGFAGPGIYFAFTMSENRLYYISLTDFEDEDFNIYNNTGLILNGNIIEDTKTGMSTFASGSAFRGEIIDKLIFFGNYLWAQHSFSISYKSSSNSVWSSLIHKNFLGNEITQSDLDYSPTGTFYLDKRLSRPRTKYKFQGHHATSGHVMLIACYNSVQQIKFNGNSWEINNIDSKVANLHNNQNTTDTTVIVGLDYAEDVIDGVATAAWYVIVASPHAGHNSSYNRNSQFGDYWAYPKIYRYAESVKEDTRKMQGLDTNPFEDQGRLPSFPFAYYIMQALPYDNYAPRIQWGTPAVVAVRAGFLYILATKGSRYNNRYQLTDEIIGYKYKIDDATSSSIAITEKVGNRRLNTFSYMHSGSLAEPIAGVTPIKVADKLLLPIAVQENTTAYVNNTYRRNGGGNFYLVTACP